MFARCVQNTNARDHDADAEQRRPRPTREQQDATGSDDRGDQLPARRTRWRSTTTTNSSERDGHRQRREREEHAGGGRDALPALLNSERRPHVADDRRDAAGDRPDDRLVRRRRSATGERAPGARPSTHRRRTRSRPIFAPSTRNTFVAPRLPEPCFRRSTPCSLPARYAAGIDPRGRRAPRRRSAMRVRRSSAALRRIRCAADCP